MSKHEEPAENYAQWTTGLERALVELAWSMRDKKPIENVQGKIAELDSQLRQLTYWINNNYKGRG